MECEVHVIRCVVNRKVLAASKAPNAVQSIKRKPGHQMRGPKPHKTSKKIENLSGIKTLHFLLVQRHDHRVQVSLTFKDYLQCNRSNELLLFKEERKKCAKLCATVPNTHIVSILVQASHGIMARYRTK